MQILIDRDILRVEVNKAMKILGGIIHGKYKPSQTDAYRLALRKEKESIELYEKLKEEATDEESKELFAFLIEMEKNHYKIFEELVNHLRHGEEWVEDAEFGHRGTY